MAPQLDPATREALAARMRFYRDLGLTEFYRRPVDPAPIAAAAIDSGKAAPVLETAQEDAPAAETARGDEPAQSDFFGEESAIPAHKRFAASRQSAQSVATADRVADYPADRPAALRLIQEDIGDCTRCALHTGRHTIVFADGDANARLMFVGEGPGADEDAQGLPFVGRAGQLLNNMISAMGLKREEVYIANVVKCRPPGNRTPEPVEANTCMQFLWRQIDVVRPQVLVALGATAATYLLGQRQPLAGLRGRVHALRGASLIVTYHPAYLLRDPRQKKEAWADLQIAMKELGLKSPAKS